MRYDDFRAALSREPFLPFEVHTQAGETYPVAHPENVGSAPRLPVVMIRYDGAKTAMIALDAITEVTYPVAAESKPPG